MAKAVRKAAARKASKAPAPIKPVKATLTKSALISLIAEENEITRKTAAGVYATLENLFLGSVHPRGVGEFILPGPSEGQSAQGSGAQGRDARAQPCDGRNGQGRGKARQRSSKDPRPVEAEDGCEPLIRRACRPAVSG